MIRLQQLFQAVNVYDRFLSIDAKRVTTVENCYRLIRDLHLTDDKKLLRILLDVQVENAEKVILEIVSKFISFDLFSYYMFVNVSFKSHITDGTPVKIRQDKIMRVMT